MARTARTTRTAADKAQADKANQATAATESADIATATPAPAAPAAPSSPGLAALAGLVSTEAREAAQRAALVAVGVEVDADTVLPTGGYNAGRVTPGTHANGFRAAREAKGHTRKSLREAWGVPASVVWHAEFNATGDDLAGFVARLAATPNGPRAK